MRIHILLMCFLLSGPTIVAQSIVNDVLGSAGMHSVSPTGVHLSWTIGEPIVETVSDNTYILTQGFHQPWEPQETIGEPPSMDPQLTINVYPNPVRELLTVSLENNPGTLFFDLYDISGRLIAHQKSAPNQDLVTFPIRWLSAGSYLLKITTKNYGIHTTYRLQKLR